MSAIKDYILGFYDGPHATPKEAGEGPIFLGIKNVTPDGRLDFSEIRHVSDAEFPKWTKRVTPKKDDIVFTYEASLHRYAIIPAGFHGCLGRRMALMRPDTTKVFPRFLHYYCLSSAWRKEAEASVISGATVDRIPLTKVPDFKVDIPDLPTQERIAGILSAYDDLIENNRRRIALLEQAARLLYREWFVHFRFPGHETAKFVDGLPEGWERKALGDVCATNKSSYKKGNLPNHLSYIDIGSVSTGQIDGKTEFAAEDAPGRARRIVEPMDTIWSNVRPNLKAYALVMSPEENDVFSTGFTVIHAEDVSPFFVYFTVTTEDFVKHLNNHATGVSYPAVRSDDFERAKITVPPEDLMAEFHTFCEPLFMQRQKLAEENMKLTKARDLLLPRLMDGRIPVKV
jgi:type I restriction enzyme S subunit